ncbi:MAG: PASTA domain-containing protein [Bacteroidales bacterium]|nr:PASTA domain-containing protein [Bacteroidales bacterium]
MAENRKERAKQVGKKAAGLKDNWILKHLVLSGCAVLVLLFVLFTLLKFITRHNQELEVPSFINMSVQQAEELARSHSMRLEVTDSVYINRMAPGAIFRQNPQAGGKVKKNRRILLTINAMLPKMVSMPSTVGYSLRQAQSELLSSQLVLGKLIYVDDIATNNVIEQLYRGRPIAPGAKLPGESVIDLKVGVNRKDSAATFVPEMRAVPYRLVRERLAEHSLNIKKLFFDESVKNYADSMSALVYRQIPQASDTVQVELGTGVTLYLSKTIVPVIEKPESTEEEE